MIKKYYISLLLFSAFVAGCNPGIVPVVAPPPTDASAYFFPKSSLQPMTFKDSSSAGVKTVKVVTLQQSANSFYISENTADSSLLCTVDSASVKLYGLSVSSIIPIPDGFRIKPDSVYTTQYSYPAITHIAVASGNIVAFGSDGQIYYKPISASAIDWKTVSGTNYSSLVSKSNPVTAVATSGSRIYVGNYSGDIWVTSDGGSSWAKLPNWTSHYSISAIAASSSPNISTLYVSAHDSVYRIENPGSISRLSSKKDSSFISLVYTRISQQIDLIAGISQGSTIQFRTSALATDWSAPLQHSPSGRGINLFATPSNNFYCSTSEGLWTATSADSIVGLNYWSQISGSGSYAYSFFAYDSVMQSVIAMGPKGNVTVILSNQSGYSSTLNNTGEIHGLAASGSNYFAATDSGVFTSTARDTAWTNIGPSFPHSTSHASNGAVTLLHSEANGSLDSSWAADTLIASGGGLYPFTGHIVHSYDSLTVARKTYLSVIEVQYSSTNKSIPYLQIFYAKNEGPVVIYQISPSATREIYRTE